MCWYDWCYIMQGEYAATVCRHAQLASVLSECANAIEQQNTTLVTFQHCIHDNGYLIPSDHLARLIYTSHVYIILKLCYFLRKLRHCWFPKRNLQHVSLIDRHCAEISCASSSARMSLLRLPLHFRRTSCSACAHPPYLPVCLLCWLD